MSPQTIRPTGSHTNHPRQQTTWDQSSREQSYHDWWTMRSVAGTDHTLFALDGTAVSKNLDEMEKGGYLGKEDPPTKHGATAGEAAPALYGCNTSRKNSVRCFTPQRSKASRQTYTIRPKRFFAKPHGAMVSVAQRGRTLRHAQQEIAPALRVTWLCVTGRGASLVVSQQETFPLSTRENNTAARV